MVKTFVADECEIGMVLENDTASLTDGSTALDDAAVLGGFYDSADQTLFTFDSLVDTVTIDGFDPIIEEFQCVSTPYMKRRQVRQSGGVTFSFKMAYDSGASGTETDVGAQNIIEANLQYQKGVSRSIAGDVETPDAYNALEDVNEGSETTDLTGWAVEVLVGAAYKFVFHNATISVSGPEIGYQKAHVWTIKVEDARLIEHVGAASLANHTDA